MIWNLEMQKEPAKPAVASRRLSRKRRWRFPFVATVLVLVFGLLGALPTAQANSNRSTVEGESELQNEKESRAWEYRRYDVKVWMVHDGSYKIRSVFDRLCDRLRRDTLLVDPIGWRVGCEKAPPLWNHRFRHAMENPEEYTEALIGREDLAGYDKLIVVKLDVDGNGYTVRTRELDTFTRHWGALVEFTASDQTILSNRIYESVATAFMPLTRIERVTKNDDVFVRLRAVALAKEFAGVDENGEAILVPNELSPTWVRDDDILLPVVRRLDKKTGEVSKISVIEWTYLLIKQNMTTTLRCNYETSQYAPLAGRSGRFIQKMALVIRPPQSATRLTLISRDRDNPRRLQGLEIYSRRPGQDRELASELLGKTDWKGSIDIPPIDSGIRLIYVKNGQRALAELPVIPGLYEHLVAKMPDDKSRLFAEGVVRGLQGELVDLLTRRNMLKTRIEIAFEKGNTKEAFAIFDDQYNELPDAEEFRLRLSRTKQRLLSRGKPDNRQREKIGAMFVPLEEMVKRFVSDSEKTTLSRMLEGKEPPPSDEEVLKGETTPEEQANSESQ